MIRRQRITENLIIGEGIDDKGKEKYFLLWGDKITVPKEDADYDKIAEDFSEAILCIMNETGAKINLGYARGGKTFDPFEKKIKEAREIPQKKLDDLAIRISMKLNAKGKPAYFIGGMKN